MASYSGVVTGEMIPVEVRQPFPPAITPDMLKIRLHEGGTIKFTAATHELVGGGFSDNTYTFLACDKFIMKNSKIITNGNTLIIFCNVFSSEDSQIISFEGNDKKALRGPDGSGPSAHGEAGDPGDSGGLVSIHIIEKIEGHIFCNLAGQDGGDGGNAVDGAPGSRGGKGSASKSGVLFWGISTPS